MKVSLEKDGRISIGKAFYLLEGLDLEISIKVQNRINLISNLQVTVWWLHISSFESSPVSALGPKLAISAWTI